METFPTENFANSRFCRDPSAIWPANSSRKQHQLERINRGKWNLRMVRFFMGNFEVWKYRRLFVHSIKCTVDFLLINYCTLLIAQWQGVLPEITIILFCVFSARWRTQFLESIESTVTKLLQIIPWKIRWNWHMLFRSPHFVDFWKFLQFWLFWKWTNSDIRQISTEFFSSIKKIRNIQKAMNRRKTEEIITKFLSKTFQDNFKFSHHV